MFPNDLHMAELGAKQRRSRRRTNEAMADPHLAEFRNSLAGCACLGRDDVQSKEISVVVMVHVGLQPLGVSWHWLNHAMVAWQPPAHLADPCF